MTVLTAEIVDCHGDAADSMAAAAAAAVTPAVDYSNNSACWGSSSPPDSRPVVAGNPGHMTIAQSPAHCLLYVCTPPCLRV